MDEPHGTAELLLDEILNAACAHPFRARISAFDVSPHRWLVARRVNKAKELLERSNLALAQVATLCGFSSQSHLNAASSNTLAEPRTLAPHIPAIDR